MKEKIPVNVLCNNLFVITTCIRMFYQAEKNVKCVHNLSQKIHPYLHLKITSILILKNYKIVLLTNKIYFETILPEKQNYD